MDKKSIKLTDVPPVAQLTYVGLGHWLVPFAGIASPSMLPPPHTQKPGHVFILGSPSLHLWRNRCLRKVD